MKATAASAAMRVFRDDFIAFGAWWLHELRETAMQIAERFRPGYSSRFVLEMSAGGGVIRSVGPAAATTELRFDLTEEGGLPPLPQIWPEGAPASASVSVTLPPAKLLLCQLQLPPLRDSDLASVIALRLERELPLPAEQVCVDWESGQPDGGEWRFVDIAIARRADVERLRGEIQSWKWQVTSIGMQSGDGPPRFNLLPPRVHRLNLAMGRRDWRMLSAAAILSGIYLLTIVGQWQYERASVAAQLDEARALLSKMERQQSAIADRGKPVVALRQLMTAASSSQVLAAMSAAIPANSWVYEMRIRAPTAANSSVELEAYTPAAAALVDALEKSPAFEQVQLVRATSAVTSAVGAGGGDRVELTARLQKEPVQ